MSTSQKTLSIFVSFLVSQLNTDGLIVSAERWTDLIEQTTMLMMILGRWLLPAVQGMTKDSLSQLLLINLAMCADIIEFFDILKLGFVRNSPKLIITILVLWTWSLMQFPFNAMSKFEGEEDGVNEGTSTKGNKSIRGRRSIVPFEGNLNVPAPSSKNRASMTSLDFKQAIHAKRISRDILLMSHNYSRGLPRDYLPDFRRNSYQPRLEETSNVSENNNSHEERQSNASECKRSAVSGQTRGPGRFSLDVGQMRSKRLTGDMTASITSPNLMFHANEEQDQLRPSKEKTAQAQKPSSPGMETARIDMQETEDKTSKKSRLTSELVGILMSLFMQDGPFLTFRLFIIAHYQAYEYMIIFLTAKNSLVLALQVYRLCVLHCTCYDHKENDFSPENEIDANSRLKNVQVAVTHDDNEPSEDSSLHELVPWTLTGKLRNSLRNPFFYPSTLSRQTHLAA